jgi:hypothetical protein
MPVFNGLRSDYPLNLTLLERPYARALKQSYRDGLTSAPGIPVPFICSKWSFLARLFADRAFDAQHYSGTNGRHCPSVESRICTRSRNNFCSSACAPSTSESTCGLAHVRALVRAFWLNIDDQLAHLFEHWCASPRGNTELDSRELAASLLSPKSAACVVVAVHLLSTSRPSLADNHSSPSGLSNAGLDARSALRVCHFLACLFVDSRASQINLGGAHDVSKQRSSKF